MPFLAFEGPAGTGKTYRLIDEVRVRAPELLGVDQRILGLTFMHGSRRRLDESFSAKAEIRGRGYSYERGIRVMTIQAAKNRQFRDVVVLWGPGIPGSADHQRRLLYNAISRAENNCTVMVRTQQLLQQPPFV